MKRTQEQKIRSFVYAQQLPNSSTCVDHVTQVALETCQCSHLQEYLPHLLDWELNTAPHGWVIANPVHAMHLESQLDPGPTDHLPPILYGAEEQRTDALHTEGVVEYWCPLDGASAVIHDDTALAKMEHWPTIAMATGKTEKDSAKDSNDIVMEDAKPAQSNETLNTSVKSKQGPADAVMVDATEGVSTDEKITQLNDESKEDTKLDTKPISKERETNESKDSADQDKAANISEETSKDNTMQEESKESSTRTRTPRSLKYPQYLLLQAKRQRTLILKLWVKMCEARRK